MHRISAYSYDGETLCPDCMLEAVPGDDTGESLETQLAAWAGRQGINHMDERSYDSGDFPKVVFEYQLVYDEHCDECGTELE